MQSHILLTILASLVTADNRTWTSPTLTSGTAAVSSETSANTTPTRTEIVMPGFATLTSWTTISSDYDVQSGLSSLFPTVAPSILSRAKSILDCKNTVSAWYKTETETGSITASYTISQSASVVTLSKRYAANNYTTTLCDGLPRILYSGGTPSYTTNGITTETIPESITVVEARVPNAQPCTVPSSDYTSYCPYITSLWTASSQASVSAYQEGTYYTGSGVKTDGCPDLGRRCGLMVNSAHMMYCTAMPNASGTKY